MWRWWNTDLCFFWDYFEDWLPEPPYELRHMTTSFSFCIFNVRYGCCTWLVFIRWNWHLKSKDVHISHGNMAITWKSLLKDSDSGINAFWSVYWVTFFDVKKNHQLNNLCVAVKKGSLLSVTSRLIDRLLGCGSDSNVVTMEEVWLRLLMTA